VPDGERHTLPLHIRAHEPHVALFGGPDGLEVYRRFIPQAASLLRPGGLLVLEHGAEHGDAVPAIFGPRAVGTARRGARSRRLRPVSRGP